MTMGRYFHFGRHVLLPALFLLTLAGHPALANEPKTVTIVTGNNYFPYTDESLPGGGLATQIVQRVFADLGFEAKFVFEAWEKGYADSREGRYIATFPYILSAERKKDFLFTSALFEVRPTIFWNVERNLRIIEMGDLTGKTLCIPEGWALDGYIEPMVMSGQIDRIRAVSMRACFQKLHDGDVDIVSADRRVGEQLAEDVEARPWIKSRRFSTDSNSNHLMFTRRHPQAAAWVRAFDASLKKLQDSGELYALIKAYYTRQTGAGN
ncbi:transporter substrate-binding domain-containing protein [Marivibrio halodurans]|uniref:Transporter substrate-binding domain-containing protein n=1 Tax=Marivibrio halodurans TaxID=2039722 RepID=A0A8J7SLQ0_9PROT|nr:transporter substrate-binding domain-containing protein [Marivibrio halodurans]MBP5856998.1 transporter substrate-binding domain-containing protein [Marivibrio halodurans]